MRPSVSRPDMLLRGFEQVYGVDFFETWAPVERYASCVLCFPSVLYGILRQNTLTVSVHSSVQWSEDKIKADPSSEGLRFDTACPPWVSNTSARDHLT